MTTNQQYSTRLGVRKNLKALLTRLTLDITTLTQVEVLYSDALPQISTAAKQAKEACIIVKTLVEEMRINI